MVTYSVLSDNLKCVESEYIDVHFLDLCYIILLWSQQYMYWLSEWLVQKPKWKWYQLYNPRIYDKKNLIIIL